MRRLIPRSGSAPPNGRTNVTFDVSNVAWALGGAGLGSMLTMMRYGTRMALVELRLRNIETLVTPRALTNA
jgi:hypothetical protein